MLIGRYFARLVAAGFDLLRVVMEMTVEDLHHNLHLQARRETLSMDNQISKIYSRSKLLGPRAHRAKDRAARKIVKRNKTLFLIQALLLIMPKSKILKVYF